MKKNILLVPLIICVLFSCSDNTTNPSDAKEIWPLKVGNYWVWKSTSYDTLGNVESEYTDTIIVYKDSLWNSTRIFALKSLNENIFFNFDFAYYQNGGMYGINFKTDRVDSFLIIKYPGKTGDIFIGINDTITITSINETYKTIAGDFICYKYSGNRIYGYLNEIFDMYFSPGIGMVGNELFTKKVGSVYNLEHKTELISYFVQ
ncbi:MAG: hypothetical protein HZB41_09205 [Ignavibacteriae bacterium]|nr:hypothetical protein [Ignavibacteriota bacterium]